MSAPKPEAKEARISEEVRALGALNLEELRAEWQRRWGEPPKFRSRDLMARAMAYRIQAEVSGDLAAPLRRRVAALAERFAADRTYSPVPSPELKPGTAVIREWRGVRHEVAVTAEGYVYQGETYRSLSKIAGRITGSKWNGYVFFGLKPQGG